MAKGVIVVATVVAATAMGMITSTASAATYREQRYVQTVEDMAGHAMTAPQSVIAHGHMACAWLDDGHDMPSTASMIHSVDPTVPYGLAVDETVAAAQYLC